MIIVTDLSFSSSAVCSQGGGVLASASIQSVYMFDTYSLSIAERNRKPIQSMWGKNKSSLLRFVLRVKTHQRTAVHSCAGTCASVSGHLLFTRTNTDGEVSPGVSGDEMQPRVKHGGRSFSLQLQVHFLLRRV